MIRIRRLGNMKYGEALQIQKEHVRIVKNNPDRNYLLLVEHDPVYTTGMRSREYSLQEENRLKSLGAEFFRTNRGGLITFHGPGQLVAYPIFNLKNFDLETTAKIQSKLRNSSSSTTTSDHRKILLGMKSYVHTLEQVAIETILKMGVKNPERSPHTGVWIGDNKICAMGVRNSDFITYHGIALNCNVDLTWFNNIVPCGIEGKGVTSLSRELQRNVTIDQVTPSLIKSFCENFNSELITDEKS